MNNRYIGALLLFPLIIFLFLGGAFLQYASLIIALLGSYEYYKVVKIKNFHPFEMLGYISSILYYILIGYTSNLNVFAYITILGTLIILTIPIINIKYTYIDAAITLLGFIYITVFSSFIYLIQAKQYGNQLVWLVFISSWATDITAYYVGKNFGKKKLCPNVSPNKTIEGSIGGLIGSTLFCGIAGYLFNKSGNPIPIINYLVIGALCGILCQFGDLVASSIKRYSEVKDYSHLIPGHGGILDRFDSILFASVTVYFYLAILLNI